MRFLFFGLIFITLDVFAQGVPSTNALSFAPSANDSSLIFLSNIFGVVDGVLAGTGSQLFSKMMSVFNSAILALGSIIFTYILLLGTMQTAHEGEFLGRRWSSIMIPLRTIFGLALLVPKASGYCIIQIFVIWVVVQGVGAADKVWGAALQYLNQGGKIIQGQLSSKDLSNNGTTMNPAYSGGISILAGQVCMYGLEQILKTLQAQYKAQPNGICSTGSPQMKEFCTTSVPDFLGSVDVVAYQQTHSNQSSFQIPMPNFVNNGVYNYLQGVCGEINFNSISSSKSGADNSFSNLSSAQMNFADQTRAVAVQTTYSFLANLAYTMVNNTPLLSDHSGASPENVATEWANSQFGVPLTDSGDVCSNSTQTCPGWGASSSGSQVSVLLTGNEFLNSVLAYTSVMMPVLNLNNEMANQNTFSTETAFINKAQSDGWIFAGAYFFNLVLLNGSAQTPVASIDQNSGLDSSKGPYDKAIISSPCSKPNNPVGTLCWFFNNNSYNAAKYLNILNYLIQGGDQSSCGTTLMPNRNKSQFLPSNGLAYVVGSNSSQNGFLGTLACSSTVLGFVGNSYFFNLKGQEGASAISFTPTVNLTMATPGAFNLDMDLGCHGFLCIPSAVGDIFIIVFKAIAATIGVLITTVFNLLMIIMFIGPFEAIVLPLLEEAIKILGDFSSSPIVNLANMGADFIQTTFDGYVGILVSAGATLIIPDIAPLIVLMTIFFLPFYTAWLAYFLGIGMTTAYYIPILPYMIFIFGAIGWLFSVIESVIAAPIVALAVTTPEGEGFIGKGEQGLMILLNVFLRPSLMVIGFLTGIAVSYISVWILNASFSVGAQYLQVPASAAGGDMTGVFSAYLGSSPGKINWEKYPFAQTIGCVFYVVIYISMYVTLVQKAFSLIYSIPDKILRWIGGQQESYGQETSQWVESTGQKVEEFSKKSQGGMASAFGALSPSSKSGDSGGDAGQVGGDGKDGGGGGGAAMV
jgi:defect-in-organelle-trafficking protein DotA